MSLKNHALLGARVVSFVRAISGAIRFRREEGMNTD